MNRFVMIFLLSFFTQISFLSLATADCQDRLLGGMIDSSHFQVSILALEGGNDDENLDEIYSTNAVKKILEDKACDLERAEMKAAKCQSLLNGFTGCLINTDHGYFYLVKDMVDNINVLYNRWD